MGSMLIGTVGVSVLLIVLVMVGHRMVRDPGPGSAGGADAFGALLDVFNPAAARANQDLKDHENVGPVTPVPEDEDPRSRIDLTRGTAVIRMPARPPGDGQDGPGAGR